MEFRLAQIEDCKELTKLRLAMRSEREEQFDGIDFEGIVYEFFCSNISQGSHVEFLAIDDNKIVGTVGLSLYQVAPSQKNISGKVMDLANVFVLPEYRGHGLARKLVNQAIKYAKEHGYGKIILNSAPLAKSLYESVGFKENKNEYVYYVN